jgi:membrane fusion protein (multidrug efflux system)
MPRGPILVAVALALAGCGPGSSSPTAAPHPSAAQPAAAVPISVARVESIPVDRTLPVVGTLFARDEATLSAEVEGTVEKTFVEFGDRIREGQELALVDTDSYAALAAQASARVAQAKAAAVSADHELARQQQLRSNGIASPADLDVAVANADQTRAAVKAAEAAETVARLNVSRSRIRAPFDAAVAERIASAGDFVRPGTPMFRVVNDTVLKFIVQAPEANAPDIRKGQPLRFHVDAFPGRAFEGSVFLISPQVSAATRMFSLGALVTNADLALKANTFARGEVVLARDVPTVLAPLDAIVTSSGFSRVFVVSNNLARSRDVVVGRIRNDRQEVLKGLVAGEVVAVSGLNKLRDGAAITLRDANP